MGQHTFILPVFRAEPALSSPLQRGSEVLILVAVIPYDAKLVYEDFSYLCLHCQHWNAPKLEVNLIFLYHFMKVRAVIHFFLKYWELFRWRVKREEVSPAFPLFAWQQKEDSHRLKACLLFALRTAEMATLPGGDISDLRWFHHTAEDLGAESPSSQSFSASEAWTSLILCLITARLSALCCHMIWDRADATTLRGSHSWKVVTAFHVRHDVTITYFSLANSSFAKR